MKLIAVSFGLLVATIVLLANLNVDAAVFRWSKIIPSGDTLGHFVFIGTLALLVNSAFATKRVRFGPVVVWRATIVIAVVVTFEECSQLWLVHRSFSWSDMAANWAGIVVLGELVPMALRNIRTSAALTTRGAQG